MMAREEEMNKALNKCLNSFYERNVRRFSLHLEQQIYRGEEVEGLTNINIRREDLIKQIDRFKVPKTP